MEPELAEIRDFLAAHAPFSDLPEDVLAALPGRCSLRYHRRGSTIWRPEDAVTTLLVVRSGALDVHDPAGGLVERVDVGGSVGVTGMLQPPPYGFVVTAVEDTLVLEMPKAVFDTLVTHPSVVGHFLTQQAGRLRSAVETVQVADHGRHGRDRAGGGRHHAGGPRVVRDRARRVERVAGHPHRP